MSPEEFIAEMKRIEVCGKGYLDSDKIEARRDVLWERLADEPISVLRAARNILLDSGLEYVPSVPEILAACQEAADDPTPTFTLKARYQPVVHICCPDKPAPSRALETLAVASPYEASHILCPADVPATCPRCGARRLELGVFAALMEAYPGPTTNWTPNFKGLMLCANCEAHGKR